MMTTMTSRQHIFFLADDCGTWACGTSLHVQANLVLLCRLELHHTRRHRLVRRRHVVLNGVCNKCDAWMPGRLLTYRAARLAR